MEVSEKVQKNNPFEDLATVDFGELTKYVDTDSKYPFKLIMPKDDFDKKELFRFVKSVLQITADFQQACNGAVRDDLEKVLGRLDENNFFDGAIRKTDEIDTISRLLIFFAGDKGKKLVEEERISFPFTGADLKVWRSYIDPQSGKVEFTFFRDTVAAEKLSKMAENANLKIDKS